MSGTDDENVYTGTPGREDQGEERDHRFEGFSDPHLRGAEAQNPLRGGGRSTSSTGGVSSYAALNGRNGAAIKGSR